MRSLPILLVTVLACGGSDDDDDGDEGDDAAVDAAPAGDGSACLGEARPVASEGWAHVVDGSTIEYDSNPPASGPHYDRWARYRRHDAAIARGHWVHNLEHGAVVLVHRPDAPAAVVDELAAAYEAIPDDADCGHRLSLMVPDPDLDTAVAVVAAGWVMDGECVDQAALLEFVAAHRNRAPEHVCTDGSVP